MNNLKTNAYRPFRSNQEWASDPDFAVIGIDTQLADLVVHGIRVLNDIGFDTISSSRFGVEWDIVSEHEDGIEFGYETFEPEYTLLAPDVVISNCLQFKFDIKHSGEEGWCDMSFGELAGYLDKAWVESLGYVFVQLPDDNGVFDPERWACINKGQESAAFVAYGSLMECIEAVANGLESGSQAFGYDQTMPPHLPRPKYPELRQKAEGLRQAT